VIDLIVTRFYHLLLLEITEVLPRNVRQRMFRMDREGGTPSQTGARCESDWSEFESDGGGI
jgi:hypothetical protein